MFEVFVLAEIVFDHTVKNNQLFAFSKLRWILRLHECRKAFWGGFGERICHKSNANQVRRISLCSCEFCKISSEKFHCQTIFQAKFLGNIARYFRRANEKSLFRKFAEAKFRTATNKLMSKKKCHLRDCLFPKRSEGLVEKIIS